MKETIEELKYLAEKFDLITVLGATAGGKTSFASELAYLTDREIIGADSRQVYKKMDIGTGKDLDDYIVRGKQIKYHLIDILEPGYKYNVFEYQKDFVKVYNKLKSENKKAIMCGGSGLYLESVLDSYKLLKVPENKEFRAELEKKSLNQLAEMLKSFGKVHNTSDLLDKNRAIKAIEIADFYKNNSDISNDLQNINSIVFGVKFDRDSRRKRITERLKQRLENGMIEEIDMLIKSGVSTETLIYYGLEYKFVTLYLLNQLSYNEMFKALETAIHQFSKRQMTWFRRMEKKGTKIYWLDGYLSIEDKIERVKEVLKINQ
ncbi:MAG: tRNA (adenosine(37)-N6)-dimethylallyltransferase MiaA [Bacteroidales bacterium]|nr:tRNA (adenosine(37)-N6)-dimethylallyltransferase MiaA [Bacteroidales bacterium]MBN2755763.1 tRNA (adenosine(37)-N6)-dimethylallyltransferase MiaA [Bacteroidales bacterium]